MCFDCRIRHTREGKCYKYLNLSSAKISNVLLKMIVFFYIEPYWRSLYFYSAFILTLKVPNKNAADDISFCGLLLSFKENMACCFI